jgi:tetratricopeptide (TPR) repeat protein
LGKSIGHIASAYAPRLYKHLVGRYFWVIFIGLIALVLRLGHLSDSASSPLFDAPMVDARTYVEEAAQLTTGGWAGKPEPFRQPPLYSYYLAVVFQLAEQSYFLPRFIQAVLGAAACALIYIIGRTAFSESVARGAGLTAAAYGPLIYFGGELLPTTVAIFLSLLFLLCVLRPVCPNPWNQLIAGFLLGLSALTVVNTLVFLPFFLLWLYTRADLPEGYSRIRGILFVLLGCGLAIAPVTMRNYVVGHDQVLISTDSGFSFYLDNNATYAGTVQTQPNQRQPELEWQELVDRTVTEMSIQDPSIKTRYFLAKFWNDIRRDPLQYLTLPLHKLYLFWHGAELHRNLDPYYARNDSVVLRLLMWKYGLAFPFGIVAPLALVGMVCYWRNSPGSSSGRMLLLLLLAYMFSAVMFFATAQQRLPAVPLVLLFSCFGLRQILVRQGSDRLRLLVMAAVLLAVTNLGAGTMDMEGGGFQHFVLATAYEEQGMKANAMRKYRAVLERLPEHHKSVERLGHLHISRQEYDRAIRLYKTFLGRQPEDESIRFLLANAHLKAGHFQQALAGYDDLVVRRPQWAAVHARLGYTYLQDGQPFMAISAYRRTLALQPDSSLVRYQLARLYVAQDSLQTATEEFRVLLEKDPDNADFHTRIADLLIRQQGKENTFALPKNTSTETAEAHLEEAIRRAPNRPKSHWSLGTMLARQGRYAEAMKHFERLTQLEPGNYELLVWLANLSQRTGRNEKAQQYLSRYAEVKREARRQDHVQQEMDDLLQKMFGEEKISKEGL